MNLQRGQDTVTGIQCVGTTTRIVDSLATKQNLGLK